MSEIVTGPSLVKPTKHTKVAFCLVSDVMMHTKTALDMTRAAGYCSEVMGWEVAMNHQEGSILHEARQAGIKNAVEWGADYIFSFDSDMRFPVNAVEGMAAHGVDIVAANCSKRKLPVGPTARKRNAYLHDDRGSEAVWPDPNVHGLEQVETVGFGVILIKADVFKRIEWPWFSQPWLEDLGRSMGEDIFFCLRCRDAGIPIYIDHDLSWAVKHAGVIEFGCEHVLHTRELAQAGKLEGLDGVEPVKVDAA